MLAERAPHQSVLQAGRRRAHASPARALRVCIPALTLARGAQVAERFQCLSFTLEMPFKDTQDCEDSVHGWNPARPTPCVMSPGVLPKAGRVVTGRCRSTVCSMGRPHVCMSCPQLLGYQTGRVLAK